MPDLYFYRDPEEVWSHISTKKSYQSLNITVKVCGLHIVLLSAHGVDYANPSDSLFAFLLCQIEKEEQAAAEKAVGKEEYQGEWTAPVADFAQPEVADWSEGVQVPSVPIQQFPAAIDGMFWDTARFCSAQASELLRQQDLNCSTFLFISFFLCPAAAAAKAAPTTEVFAGEFIDSDQFCLRAESGSFLKSTIAHD